MVVINEDLMIRWMRKCDRDRVQRFVNERMRERYGCDAYALSVETLLAFRKRELVGTICIERVGSAFAEFFRSDRTIHIGRWTATRKGIAEILLFAIILRSLNRGAWWGLSEVKPAVARRLQSIGLIPVLLHGAIRRGQIAREVAPYYEVPTPRICIVSLDRSLAALRMRIGDETAVAIEEFLGACPGV